MSSPQGNVAFRILTQPDPSLDFQVQFCPQCTLSSGSARFLTCLLKCLHDPAQTFSFKWNSFSTLPTLSNTSVHPAWLTLEICSPRRLLWSFPLPRSASLPHAPALPCTCIPTGMCPAPRYRVPDSGWSCMIISPNKQSGGSCFRSWYSSSTKPSRNLALFFFFFSILWNSAFGFSSLGLCQYNYLCSKCHVYATQPFWSQEEDAQSLSRRHLIDQIWSHAHP